MKKLAIAACLLVGAVVMWRLFVPSVTMRYRLTLELQVNGETKSGSGVIEVTYSKVVPIGTNFSGGVESNVRGEAVVVDLGNNDVIVSLLADGPNPRSGPDNFIPVLFGITRGRINISDFHSVANLKGKREVPFDFLPFMIRFLDAKNRMNFEVFDPLKGASSPKGPITLQRAIAEIVDPGWPLDVWGWTGTPITRGIERKLPWLIGFQGNLMGSGDRDWSRPESRINDGYFIEGISR